MALQHRLQNLQNLQDAKIISQELPDSLADLKNWAEAELVGDIVVHQKAIKSTLQSNFHNPQFIYEVLLLLRAYYVPMRREGKIELKKVFDDECARLGLENSACFANQEKAKNFEGDYYRIYDERKCLLDYHLKGNNSRDSRFGFRLYYFWDVSTNMVVVWHMPTHLDTDAS